MIDSLIDKNDTFEIVRNKIALILANEVVSQKALAVIDNQDPALWDLKIYTERSNPWEQVLNNVSETTPIVNVWYDSSDFNKGASNVMERQASETVYNIDIYGFGVASDEEEGHTPGDEKASLEAQRAVRLVRNILMSADYTYLGLRGVVWGRWIRSISAFQPQQEGRTVQQVVALRISFVVNFNEIAPQITPEVLEQIDVTIYRAEDGSVLARAFYPPYCALEQFQFLSEGAGQSSAASGTNNSIATVTSLGTTNTTTTRGALNTIFRANSNPVLWLGEAVITAQNIPFTPGVGIGEISNSNVSFDLVMIDTVTTLPNAGAKVAWSQPHSVGVYVNSLFDIDDTETPIETGLDLSNGFKIGFYYDSVAGKVYAALDAENVFELALINEIVLANNKICILNLSAGLVVDTSISVQLSQSGGDTIQAFIDAAAWCGASYRDIPGCLDATAVLKNTLNETLDTVSIQSGGTADIIAPDASVTINGTPVATVASDSSVNIPVEQGGLPVGSLVGDVWDIPEPPASRISCLAQRTSSFETTGLTTGTWVPVVATAAVAPSIAFENQMSVLGNFRQSNDSGRTVVGDFAGNGVMTHSGISTSVGVQFTIGIWDGAEFVPDLIKIVTLSLSATSSTLASGNAVKNMLFEEMELEDGDIAALMVNRTSGAQDLRIWAFSFGFTERG